jgi:hypothetical protein
MKLFYTELIKLKNTFALWLTLAGALFVPVILFATYLSDIKAFTPQNGADPWQDFLVRTLNGCCFFSAGFILLIIGMVIHIEHKSNAWKHLFTLPVSKGRIYLGKLTVILAMIACFSVLYLLCSVLSGFALGYFAPDLGFAACSLPWRHIFGFLSEFSIAILPAVLLHYWLSFRLKNLIISLGIGLGGLMIGLLLRSWKYVIYLPYAAPFQLLNYKEGNLPSQQGFYLLSAGYTVLLVLLSHHDFTKRFRG